MPEASTYNWRITVALRTSHVLFPIRKMIHNINFSFRPTPRCTHCRTPASHTERRNHSLNDSWHTSTIDRKVDTKRRTDFQDSLDDILRLRSQNSMRRTQFFRKIKPTLLKIDSNNHPSPSRFRSHDSRQPNGTYSIHSNRTSRLNVKGIENRAHASLYTASQRRKKLKWCFLRNLDETCSMNNSISRERALTEECAVHGLFLAIFHGEHSR